MALAVHLSGQSSKFFPPPYRPDVDGPPLSILDMAKQKLLFITQHLNIQEQQYHLDLLTDSPGYAAFFLASFNRYERLLNAKPVLIQGMFASPEAFRFSTLHVIQNVSRTIHGSSSLP